MITVLLTKLFLFLEFYFALKWMNQFCTTSKISTRSNYKLYSSSFIVPKIEDYVESVKIKFCHTSKI